MNRVWLVLKNEFINVVFRRSFFLTLLLIPVVSFIVMFLVNVEQDKNQGTANPVMQLFLPPQQKHCEGVVDLAGVVKLIPEDSLGLICLFPDEIAARAAVQAGQIDSFDIIAKDYLQSGHIIAYRQDFNPLGSLTSSGPLRDTLVFNLLKGQEPLLGRYGNPMDVNAVYLAEQTHRETGSILNFLIPYIVTLIFYVVIFGSSSLLLSSVNDEKKNQVLEVLLTSIKPLEMLGGKIIALGIVGLLQTAVWSGLGYLLLRMGGTTFNIPASFQLPPSILFWGLLFFILGYALFSSLMAGVGALVPNLREASQVTMIVALPLFVPIVMIGAISNQPNGVIALVLSFFPLTSPVSMMTRLAATAVPVWQILLSAAILVVTAYFVIRAVAGLFRAQTLLSGQKFNLKLFFRSLAGKA